MTLISRLVFFTEKKIVQKPSEAVKTADISIVIPVKDNQKGIDNFFVNFFNTHSKDKFPKEIIIVCNNSKVKTEIRQEFLNKFSKIQVFECTKLGPASARNLGVQQTKGKWVLFVDSDCIPTENLISGYETDNKNTIAYSGNVKSLKQDWLSKYYETQEILIPLKIAEESGRFAPQYLITANCLVWKPAFEEVGGFNENITIAGGEDVDLGLRLSLIGKLDYAFNSLVLHDFDDGILGFWKRFRRYGKGNKLVEKIYGTNMKPAFFRPNKRSFMNEILAKTQWLALTIGYYSK